MVSQDINETVNRICMIVLIAVAVVFAVIRNIVRWWKAHAFQLEDFFLWLAVASYIAYCGMAMATLPILTKLSALLTGELDTPWPTVQDDLAYLVKMIFAFQFLFWLTLWSVKLSLLWMFRRLTVDIPRYNKAWLVILIFTIVTLIGCFVSNLTACHSFEAWFTPGECTLPTDTVRKAASLWYSLAADLITDMLIMAIPISLLWNLRITLLEKLSVAVAFSVGMITMIFAIVRCVALDSTAGGGQVSTTWLVFWATTEGFVAILVGCLPPFAIFIRSRFIGSRYVHSNGDSYSSGHPSSNSKSRARTQSVQLHDVELDPRSDNNMQGDNSRLNGGLRRDGSENEVGRGY